MATLQIRAVITTENTILNKSKTREDKEGKGTINWEKCTGAQGNPGAGAGAGSCASASQSDITSSRSSSPRTLCPHWAALAVAPGPLLSRGAWLAAAEHGTGNSQPQTPQLSADPAQPWASLFSFSSVRGAG